MADRKFCAQGAHRPADSGSILRIEMDSHLQSAAVSSRPLRHLINLWMVIAVYVSLKGVTLDSTKPLIWGLAILAGAFLLVWRIGQRSAVRRFIELILSDEPSCAGPLRNLTATESNHAPKHPQLMLIKALGQTSYLQWAPFFVGLLMVAAAFVSLEIRQPYFFTQDDNLAQFMPVIIAGCRSLLNDGIFSTWNPHQFLGSPTSSLGVYALTYPPSYASYAIARWLLHNEFATLEVFCIGHLLAGYAATYWAGRQLGLDRLLAATTGICFALSGFFLIGGRSWYYMTPTAVWVPLLIGLLVRLRDRSVGWKWVLATGGVTGALFHAGNAQMWCYAMLMYTTCVVIWWFCSALTWSQLNSAIAALLMGLALAMPLLLPQFRETSDLHRLAGDGIMLPYLGALFVPYPLATASYPGVPESPHFDHMSQLYYAGTVFSIAAAVGMVSLLAHRWNRRLLSANVWLLLGWMALILSTGRIGGLWYLFGKFPPFTSFEHPFKFVPFAVLFMLLGGALLIERAMRRIRRSYWQPTICAAALACLTFHVCLPLPSFCNYGFQPYPPPPAELQALRDNPASGRILAIGPNRSLAPEFGQSLMHQWPTVWGFDSLGGYDPLVSGSPRFAVVTRRLVSSAALLGMQIDLAGAEMQLTPQVLEIEKHDPTRSALNLLSNPPADEQEMWGHSPHIDPESQLSALRAYGVRWIAIYSGP